MGENNLATVLLAAVLGLGGGWLLARKNPSVVLKVPCAYDLRKGSADPYYLDLAVENPDGRGDALVATYMDRKFLVEEASLGVPVFVPFNILRHELPDYDADKRNELVVRQHLQTRLIED